MDFRIGNGVLALLHLLCLVFGIVVAVLPGSLCSWEYYAIIQGVKSGGKNEMNFFTVSAELITEGKHSTMSSSTLWDGLCDRPRSLFQYGRAEVIIICIFAGISMIIHAASAAVPTLPKVLRKISAVSRYLTMCISVMMGITMILLVVEKWGVECHSEKSLKDQGYDFGAGLYISFVITVLCFIGCVIDCRIKQQSSYRVNHQYQAYEAGNTEGSELSDQSAD